VLVVGPKYAIGASRLVVVGADGRVRTARLDRIRSGWSRSGSGADVIAHEWDPGLDLDRSTGRAFVVQAGAPVAEVDLRRLGVRYHELSEPISFLGRLRNWLEPKAEAKGMQGPQRNVVWLGGGLLAVTGTDYRLSHDAQGRLQETDVPAGLKLVDTRTWRVRTLDRATTTVTHAHGVLFAYGTSWDSRTSKTTGEGLTAYDASGHELYHRYGDEPIYSVTAAPRGVMVAGNASSSAFEHEDLLDAVSGRVIRRLAGDFQLVSADEPFWY
jgi:YD repeat-containing protein